MSKQRKRTRDDDAGESLGRKSTHDRTLADAFSSPLTGYRSNIEGIVSSEDARGKDRPYRGTMKINMGLNEDVGVEEEC